MRVLLLTNMYPTPEHPANGIFVHAQVESLRALGIEFELLVVDGRGSRCNYLRAIAEVRRRAARCGFDLIHAHHGLSGFIAVQQRHKPVAVTFVGSDVLGTPTREGRVTLRGRLQPILARHAARRAQRVIVVSRQLGERLEGLGHRPEIIPMGVDLKLFQPRDEQAARSRLGLDDGRPRVLFAGRVGAAVKRFELAREAVEMLRRKRPEVELHVMSGQAPYEEVVDAMNACGCLLLTSRHEGSPQVVKEAMACNLPVVSTRVGDVEERFGGLPGHFLVEPDAAAIADALEKALAHGRTAGRERMRELDLPAIAARVYRVYQELAGASSPLAAETLASNPTRSQ
jgi:glycosyltransferase involved in cell wall biosynthesis